MKKTIGIFLVGFSLFWFCSCVPELVPPDALLDTPPRHVKNGMKFLRAGKVEASLLEFKRALELDNEFSPAYAGIGLIDASKGDYAKAMERMAVADLYARDRLENVTVHVGFMRIYLAGRENIAENWLEKMERRYQRAVLLAPESPDAYFYMGLAYKKVRRYEEASKLFLTVLQMNGDYVEEASAEYAIVRDLESGSSG
jgi:tetratricopeptide (TPR) repeat protein